jgi:predicted transposase/invertase (TIGR01784 family)
MVDAFRRGEEKGILEGEFRSRLNTSKTMVKEGFTVDQIQRITGLTKEDLLKNGILI